MRVENYEQQIISINDKDKSSTFQEFLIHQHNY